MNQSDLSTIADLKNALFISINDVLSANTETRRVAEDKISAMEIMEDFPLHLCEFSLNTNFHQDFRHMSSILLKKYIESYWDSPEEHHVLQNFVLRNRIRKNLLEGLKISISKIRHSFAYCVSYIAFMDYPEKWPTFFVDMRRLIVTEKDNEYAVHGTLRVYEDLVREYDLSKMSEMAEPLLSELCFLLLSNDSYAIQVRIETVHVLCLCASICNSGENPMKDALNEQIVSLCERFVEILQSEETCINHYGFKANIIRFFTLLVQRASKAFAHLIIVILPTIWRMVQHYGEFYIQSVINNDVTAFDDEDEEGKLVGFTPLVLSLFNFIHCLVECPKLSPMLYDVFSDIFYHIIIFMHITKNMEQAWLSDPNTLIDDEFSENFDTTIRVAARDVLMMICHDFDNTVVDTHICRALSRHTAGLQFVVDEWKVHECLMFAMGCIRDVVIRASFSNGNHFHLFGLAGTWQFALNHPEKTLLFGRAMWFGGKFSCILSESVLQNYLKYTSTCLKSSDPILQIFSIRTVAALGESYSNHPKKHLVKEILPNVIECLLENLENSQSIFPLFVLSLHALKVILWLEPNKISYEPKLSGLIMNLIMKHYADPDVVIKILEIVKGYLQHFKTTPVTIREKLIPFLANILSDGKHPCDLQTIAMDVVQTISKFCKQHIYRSLISIVFPAAINCILRTDDQILMCSGGECLRSFIMVCPDQVCSYIDTEGKSGVEYILRALTHLLDPGHPEETCRKIGRLIITMISKLGHALGTNMHYLLRAILSKMQRIETMDVWQSLLIVFIYLFYTEMEFVISFLTSVPGPTGKSALEFVLTEWFIRVPFFVNTYERVVSILGLTKILEYSATAVHDILETIMVRDEYIHKTISPMKEPGWTQIPVLAKAFKLVTGEIAHHLEKNAHLRSGDFDEGDDSDDEINSQLSVYRYCDTDPDLNDNIFSRDPIFDVNVLVHLTNFVHKFKVTPRFQWYVNFLSLKEKNALVSLGLF